jgi:hypothetical protein
VTGLEELLFHKIEELETEIADLEIELDRHRNKHLYLGDLFQLCAACGGSGHQVRQKQLPLKGTSHSSV